MSELMQAVAIIIEHCLGVGPGEDALVIADEGTRMIGEALRGSAAERGSDAVLAIMDERATDGTEPPASIAAAHAACEIYIAATTRSLSHTMARKRATDAGVRGATMPGVTPEMLARAMTVEFENMAARSNAIAKRLTEGKAARVTCPLGTDATFDLTGRSGIADDGNLRDPGAFGNLPAGRLSSRPWLARGGSSRRASRDSEYRLSPRR